MDCFSWYEYINVGDGELFTVVYLPKKEGKFPVVVSRSPYEKQFVNTPQQDVLSAHYCYAKAWVERGYAVVHQHCKGQGKSTGEFVAYIHEREDGLNLREWIRKQPFYNGEIFLVGASYTASVHYATAPFESDIKGAVFEVQDSERYRLWYRNGQMRKGHANWHFDLYKQKCNLKKHFSIKSFSALPLKNLSQTALGEVAQDFEEMLTAPNPEHNFWRTRFGGIDAKNAVSNTNASVLLTTGYNDFYVGGVFEMWRNMSQKTRKNCALVVSPYNHGDSFNTQSGICFENANRREAFGKGYQIDWFDSIRNNTAPPFKKGEVTYYRTFENAWGSDDFSHKNTLEFSLGNGVKELCYNPKNPPSFNCEGVQAESFLNRPDVVTAFTPHFEKDVFVKGKMAVELKVQSDCEDTSFYVRISLEKSGFTYTLRHDITSLCYQLGDYRKNTEAVLNFSFDDYAFLIKKGERLRIDISSTDDNSYVSHTNFKGAYHLQKSAKTALNRVDLGASKIILPLE